MSPILTTKLLKLKIILSYSHVLLNVLLISSDILPVSDGLNSRQISIKALGLKKKKPTTTKKNPKQTKKKNPKTIKQKNPHMESALFLHTTKCQLQNRSISLNIFFKCKQVFVIKMARILTN